MVPAAEHALPSAGVPDPVVAQKPAVQVKLPTTSPLVGQVVLTAGVDQVAPSQYSDPDVLPAPAPEQEPP